jgi:hypothetical protein
MYIHMHVHVVELYNLYKSENGKEKKKCDIYTNPKMEKKCDKKFVPMLEKNLKMEVNYYFLF